MDQARTEAGPSVDSRLPADIAARLEPQEQHALDNRVRREILRTLMDLQPQTAGEISASLVRPSLSAVEYHLAVLSECGSVVAAPTLASKGGGRRLYVPAVADERVVSALWRMRKPDEHMPRRVPRLKSPIGPRGLISIRLGNRRKSR